MTAFYLTCISWVWVGSAAFTGHWAYQKLAKHESAAFCVATVLSSLLLVLGHLRLFLASEFLLLLFVLLDQCYEYFVADEPFVHSVSKSYIMVALSRAAIAMSVFTTHIVTSMSM
jgi:hypothetical protein